MATGVRCITYKNAYEIPHIIQGGFHPERRRSDGGFFDRCGDEDTRPHPEREGSCYGLPNAE